MLDNRVRAINKIIPDGQKILDVGCGVNPEVHLLLAKRCQEIVGIDIDSQKLAYLREKGFAGYEMNAEEMELETKFNYIVAGEVIEHLSNPGKFLEAAKKHLAKGGKIILTTPNISAFLLYFLVVFLNLSQDPTHVYYFDKKNIESLIKRYNLRVTEFQYIPPQIKFMGPNLFLKVLFFLATFLDNVGFLFSRRLFASYLLLVLEQDA